MKFFHCIVIGFLFNYCAIAQSDTVVFEGIVTIDGIDEPVENAFIHLKLSSGSMLSEKTDALGKYKFTIKDTVSNFNITLSIDKSTKSKYSSCFFATKDEGKGVLKANTNFIKNFQLTKGMDCGGAKFPSFLFIKNSILCCNDSLNKIDSIYYERFESSIILISQTLKENPTITIELDGHASSCEKQPELLSLNRAEFIKEALVSKGINKNRIQTKGWGNQKLLIKDNVVKNAKSKEEKMALHLKNRRVVFRIIGWDFKE